MAQVEDLVQIWSKRKAITAFFPHAIWQERGGDRRMIDAFLGVARASESDAFMWTAIKPFIPTLFDRASPWTVVLASPHVPWDGGLPDENAIATWAVAALEIPYTEEVDRNVTDMLLRIASIDSLRQGIPVDIWAWLNIRPSLRPVYLEQSMETAGNVVRLVRELGDAEILTSYFLLWSEWGYIFDGTSWTEMEISIREDLDGIGLGRNREVLVERLDHVLGQLDRGPEHLEQSNWSIDEFGVQLAKEQYMGLKEAVLEVDMDATEILTRTPSRLINLSDSLTSLLTARIPLDIYLCTPSLVTDTPPFPASYIYAWLEPITFRYTAYQIRVRPSQYLQVYQTVVRCRHTRASLIVDGRRIGRASSWHVIS